MVEKAFTSPDTPRIDPKEIGTFDDLVRQLFSIPEIYGSNKMYKGKVLAKELRRLRSEILKSRFSNDNLETLYCRVTRTMDIRFIFRTLVERERLVKNMRAITEGGEKEDI
ncbi:hypothetical protein JXA05_02890 [Candidatus Peregrinibacteria bacterium]|nr:hypothetical protein [Candidatus Peregrinibacteria bacterium]